MTDTTYPTAVSTLSNADLEGALRIVDKEIVVAKAQLKEKEKKKDIIKWEIHKRWIRLSVLILELTESTYS